jgi:hypothetical protein
MSISYRRALLRGFLYDIIYALHNLLNVLVPIANKNWITKFILYIFN